MPIYPALRYRDAPVAIDFLTSAFGFTERERMSNEDGTIAHAELVYDDGIVMLGSGERGGDDSEEVRSAPISIYIAVADPDAHCEQARAAGAEITREPSDMDYGSREYGARDPEGFHWSFGTYRPTPEG
jgi:uncharacterized glyoxalase superfamily protein PhnB